MDATAASVCATGAQIGRVQALEYCSWLDEQMALTTSINRLGSIACSDALRALVSEPHAHWFRSEFNRLSACSSSALESTSFIKTWMWHFHKNLGCVVPYPSLYKGRAAEKN